MDNNMEQFAEECSATEENGEQHLQYAPGEHVHQEEPYHEQAYIQEESVQYETLQAAPKKIVKVKRPIAAKKRPSMPVSDYGGFRDTGAAIPPAKFATMKEMTEDFWVRRKRKMEGITEEEMSTKSKNMSIPMARVKKIMRIDEEVRNFNIASDAPIFMAQAAEFFIEEMTAMAWQHVSEARRRILLKSDVGTAVQKNDQFDFLIDFLPAKAPPVSTRPATRKIPNPNTVQATTIPTQRRSFSGEPPQAAMMMSEGFQPGKTETPGDNGHETVSPTSMADPSMPIGGPSFSMACPSTSMSGPSTPIAGPSTSMAGPSTSNPGPPTSMAGPSYSVAGPSTSMAGPPTSMAEPSNPMTGPSTTTASISDHQFAAPIAYKRSHESSGSPSS